MKTVVLIVVLASLTGCANLKFQWSASYQTDNLVEDLQEARRQQEAKKDE